MNHQLTTIAALPSAGGSKSAMTAEVGEAKPEIVGYWSERKPDGSYGIGVTLSDGTKAEVGVAREMAQPKWQSRPLASVTFEARDVASPVRRIVAEAAARTLDGGESTGIYAFEEGGLVRIGDAAPTPADRQGAERN